MSADCHLLALSQRLRGRLAERQGGNEGGESDRERRLTNSPNAAFSFADGSVRRDNELRTARAMFAAPPDVMAECPRDRVLGFIA
uniref:Uncharacterized protein n=1 Tax=Plectus sambesii TaxID=2011161 RepID=A0A914WSQ9_9BILA